VPYEEQQLAALTMERVGVVDRTEAELDDLAAALRRQLGTRV
jgi:hypothetical protein